MSKNGERFFLHCVRKCDILYPISRQISKCLKFLIFKECIIPKKSKIKKLNTKQKSNKNLTQFLLYYFAISKEDKLWRKKSYLVQSWI